MALRLPVWDHVTDTATAALDLLFPPRPLCPLCETPYEPEDGAPCCVACVERLPLVQPPICHGCGMPLPDPDHKPGLLSPHRCQPCQHAHRPYSLARALAVYDGALREHVHNFKFQGRRPVGLALGVLLGAYARLDRDLAVCDAVLPVPLHPARLVERGFNQAELLARGVAGELDRPLLTHALERRRPTEVQSSLPVAARGANVRGAFRVPRPATVAARTLLLVDDVFTTGATVREAARVLQRAGAADVRVLTLGVVFPERYASVDNRGNSDGGFPASPGNAHI